MGQSAQQKEPAVVKTATQQTVPVHPVQMPINIVTENDRALAAAHLALCSNFTTPHLGRSKEERNSSDVMDAQHCFEVVQTAVRNGTISDAPAMTLALRNIPFTDSKGGDNVARTMDDMAYKIAVIEPNAIAFDYYLTGLAKSEVVREPFTVGDIKAVTIKDGNVQRMPQLTSDRSIPMDPSTAYIMTAADIVAHPARYTNEGMTLAQTLAEARVRHSVEDDKKITKSCLDDDSTQDLHSCRDVAARDTAELIVNGQALPYNKELYSNARIAATEPSAYVTQSIPTASAKAANRR